MGIGAEGARGELKAGAAGGAGVGVKVIELREGGTAEGGGAGAT